MKRLKVLFFCLIAFPLTGNATSLIDVFEDALVNDPLLKEALANKEAISESRPQARSLLL
ncbi:MAG: type I secretion protein TolC, partial [Gammaproteobacteria bacterium]|nr:type I secretion protein TolC [Gammaproteobacteria bacterium]